MGLVVLNLDTFLKLYKKHTTADLNLLRYGAMVACSYELVRIWDLNEEILLQILSLTFPNRVTNYSIIILNKFS